MILALLLFTILLLALQAIRAVSLLHAAVWLAAASAMLAILFYLLGAPYIAVIELSVGAGLVTVLFIFAIGMAGEEQINLPPIIPRSVTWILVSCTFLLLSALILPFSRNAWILGQSPASEGAQIAFLPTAEAPVQVVIWGERGLDVLVQIVLIFSGVLGLLGLLAELKAPLQQPVAEEIAARRDRELSLIEEQVEQQERELS